MDQRVERHGPAESEDAAHEKVDRAKGQEQRATRQDSTAQQLPSASLQDSNVRTTDPDRGDDAPIPVDENEWPAPSSSASSTLFVSHQQDSTQPHPWRSRRYGNFGRITPPEPRAFRDDPLSLHPKDEAMIRRRYEPPEEPLQGEYQPGSATLQSLKQFAVDETNDSPIPERRNSTLSRVELEKPTIARYRDARVEEWRASYSTDERGSEHARTYSGKARAVEGPGQNSTSRNTGEQDINGTSIDRRSSAEARQVQFHGAKEFDGPSRSTRRLRNGEHVDGLGVYVIDPETGAKIYRYMGRGKSRRRSLQREDSGSFTVNSEDGYSKIPPDFLPWVLEVPAMLFIKLFSWILLSIKAIISKGVVTSHGCVAMVLTAILHPGAIPSMIWHLLFGAQRRMRAGLNAVGSVARVAMLRLLDVGAPLKYAARSLFYALLDRMPARDLICLAVTCVKQLWVRLSQRRSRPQGDSQSSASDDNGDDSNAESRVNDVSLARSTNNAQNQSVAELSGYAEARQNSSTTNTHNDQSLHMPESDVAEAEQLESFEEHEPMPTVRRVPSPPPPPPSAPPGGGICYSLDFGAMNIVPECSSPPPPIPAASTLRPRPYPGAGTPDGPSQRGEPPTVLSSSAAPSPAPPSSAPPSSTSPSAARPLTPPPTSPLRTTFHSPLKTDQLSSQHHQVARNMVRSMSGVPSADMPPEYSQEQNQPPVRTQSAESIRRSSHLVRSRASQRGSNESDSDGNGFCCFPWNCYPLSLCGEKNSGSQSGPVELASRLGSEDRLNQQSSQSQESWAPRRLLSAMRSSIDEMSGGLNPAPSPVFREPNRNASAQPLLPLVTDSSGTRDFAYSATQMPRTPEELHSAKRSPGRSDSSGGISPLVLDGIAEEGDNGSPPPLQSPTKRKKRAALPPRTEHNVRNSSRAIDHSFSSSSEASEDAKQRQDSSGQVIEPQQAEKESGSSRRNPSNPELGSVKDKLSQFLVLSATLPEEPDHTRLLGRNLSFMPKLLFPPLPNCEHRAKVSVYTGPPPDLLESLSQPAELETQRNCSITNLSEEAYVTTFRLHNCVPGPGNYLSHDLAKAVVHVAP